MGEYLRPFNLDIYAFYDSKRVKKGGTSIWGMCQNVKLNTFLIEVFLLEKFIVDHISNSKINN